MNYDGLEMVAEQLRVGETLRRICPACQGGSMSNGRYGEQSLSLTRTAQYEAKFICFRNSCGNKGVLALSGAPSQHSQDLPAKPAQTGYCGPLETISDGLGELIQRRYELGVSTIRRNIMNAGYPWLALPVRDAGGALTAYMLRWSWLAGHPPSPKTKLLLEGERRTLAWYWNRDSVSVRVLLVEDQLSAMRAAEHGRTPAAALMGTTLTSGHIQELHAAGVSEVVLALDPDALATAFAIAKKWGPAFRSFRVLAIEDDIKDLPLDKLKQLLSGI